MEEFLWRDSYSVGFDEIDKHHKKLIQLFNDVGKLLERDDKSPHFSSLKVISELNLYAIFHFKAEEKLMEEGNYPNLEAHRLAHKHFIEKTKTFKESYMDNDPLVNYDMFNYLCNWIISHIMVEDQNYTDYI